MTIHEHAESLAGLPVQEFDKEQGLRDPQNTAYRLTLDWDAQERGERFTDLFDAFLNDPGVGEVRALVIGCWDGAMEGGSSEGCVEQLVAAREKLANLRHLFLGDMISEECEASWIQQSDLSALFSAFPQLEELRIRGGSDLSLGRVNHLSLKRLIIESGGLGSDVVQQVASANLPALEHLELWLGVENYGGDATVDDLQPILAGTQFPKLRYLGLRDCGRADEIAKGLATAPVIASLEVLDLSLGTLGDEGAEALLECPNLNRLKKLDLHHHFISDDMMARLQKLDTEVDVSDQQEEQKYGEETWRYCALEE